LLILREKGKKEKYDSATRRGKMKSGERVEEERDQEDKGEESRIKGGEKRDEIESKTGTKRKRGEKEMRNSN
jgi:hypothetical protein